MGRRVSVEIPKNVTDFVDELPAYLNTLRNRTEATRRDRFLALIRDYFGVVADELEKTLHVGGVGARIAGRIDALAGNVLFEFKDDLTPGKLSQARLQLKKYVAALAGVSDPRNYTLIATDGESFQPYTWDTLTSDIVVAAVRFSLAPGHREGYFWLDDWVASRLRATRAPTAEEINRLLGTNSPVFLNALVILRKEWVALRRTNSASFDEWEGSIIQVYGENLADEELFLRHTYITTVAKILAYLAIHPWDSRRRPRSDQELLSVITGDVFRDFGVLNLGEHDFFVWVGSTEVGLGLIRGLFDACADWDFKTIPEDLLRTLYEQLIDPDTRHFLGEYYTPPWLAELVVGKTLARPSVSVLDPACGSGTFLISAIQQKLSQGESLAEILHEVVGIDVHPVAVTVARTGYLLAIQKLMANRPSKVGRFSLPVYLSNSIHSPESQFRQSLAAPGARIKTYDLTVRSKNRTPQVIQVPARAVEGDAAETILDEMNAAIEADSWTALEVTARRALSSLPPSDLAAELAVLRVTFNQIEKLHKATLNGIQVFLMRNYFRPATLKRKFDAIIGNPPWIVYNSLKDRAVQDDVKSAFQKEGIMPIGKTAPVITQLDVSALFFVRCANFYLKPGGRIRFLMPVTVLSKRQFSGFRGRPNGLRFEEIWDFSKVPGIFEHVQVCAVCADRVENKVDPANPIVAQRFEGQRISRSARLSSAERFLSSRQTEVIPSGEYFQWRYPEDVNPLLDKGPSPYHPKVRNGVTMTPFSLTFVDLVNDPVLGFDPANPAIRTGKRGLRQPRKAWRNVSLQGATESRFLFQVASMSEIVPFGHLSFHLAALPIVVNPSLDGGTVLNSEQLLSAGHRHFASYFKSEEQIWTQIQPKGKRSAEVAFAKSLNFQSKLSRHPFEKGYFVVTPNASRVITAAVLPQGIRTVTFEERSTEIQGVVIEHGNNYVFTKDPEEAHYLCAILNSAYVNAIAKPSGLRGADTERNTGKDLFLLPIPLYQPRNRLHQNLVEISRRCEAKVEGLLSSSLSILAEMAFQPANLGKLRSRIFELLSVERGQIDEIATSIIN